MPVKKCKDGYQFGKEGKCYKKRADAIKQAFAIFKSSTYDDEMSFQEFLRKEDIFESPKYLKNKLVNLNSYSEDSITFNCVNDELMLMTGDKGKLSGTVWTDTQIVSFWYKPTRKELEKFIKKWNVLKPEVKISNLDEWFIEIEEGELLSFKDYLINKNINEVKLPTVKNWKDELNKNYNKLSKDIEVLKKDIDFFNDKGVSPDNRNQKKRIKELKNKEKKMASYERKLNIVKQSKDGNEFTPSEKDVKPKLDKFEIYTEKYKELVNDFEELRKEIRFFEKTGVGVEDKKQYNRIKELEKISKKLDKLESRKDFITNYDTDVAIQKKLNNTLEKFKQEAIKKNEEEFQQKAEKDMKEYDEEEAFKNFAKSNKQIIIDLNTDFSLMKKQIYKVIKGLSGNYKTDRRKAKVIKGSGNQYIILAFGDDYIELFIKTKTSGDKFLFNNLKIKGDYKKYVNRRLFLFTDSDNQNTIDVLLNNLGFMDDDSKLKKLANRVGKIKNIKDITVDKIIQKAGGIDIDKKTMNDLINYLKSTFNNKNKNIKNKGKLQISVIINNEGEEEIRFNNIKPTAINKEAHHFMLKVMSLKAEDLDMKASNSVIFYTDALTGNLMKRYNYPVSVDDNIKLEDYTKVPSIDYDKREDISFEYNTGLHEAYESEMIGFMNSGLEVYKSFHLEEYFLRCTLTGYVLPLIYLSKQYVSLEDSMSDDDGKIKYLNGKPTNNKKEGYSFIRKNTDYINLKSYSGGDKTPSTLGQALTH